MTNDDYKRTDDRPDQEEIYSKIVRAGKRTYFFDVKTTRNDDYYITVTESLKKSEPDGTFRFEKHKIRLHKEDFDKFADGLNDAFAFIRQYQPEGFDPNDDGI